MSLTTSPITEALVSGAAWLEPTARGLLPHRLPAWVTRQFPDPQLTAMEVQPSGVIIGFRSSATRIELVSLPRRVTYAGADRPRGRIDLVVDGVPVGTDLLTGGDSIHTDLQAGTSELIPGPPHVTRFADLGGDDKLIEIWLPHNEALELISLATDMPVTALEQTTPVWVHHGSSISHGSNAAGPSDIWPAVAARGACMRLRNLGFGGSALLDPFMARVIRDAPADIISLKIGINIVNLDSMRLRTFVPAVHGFLDTIRDGHPSTPIMLITPIFCGIHEDTPGPGSIDLASLGTDQVRFIATGEHGDTAQGRLTLRVIREALAGIVATRQDAQLQLVDGLELYGPDDATALPLPDALHPDTETHKLIGGRFIRHLARA
ncbi:MAG TPA: SGNH/GDSL hydrolase family protein [Plantibacter sp.]|uniref:SGNH/GDSL hydrolase family protein n=1 Tax=unclassified Plantibacter TaxID=2624265 RepID=UPI002BA73043|nr:SGNH/GDSL hydrolase family protein [Plantibacter sp.]